MQTIKPITIVGGGLAGLTLGIGLRERSVPVRLWEAGRYPRHRVCGEFVSGRGQAILARLGLRDPLLEAGARLGRTTAFFCGQKSSPVRALPEPALCLARFRFDDYLAREFRQAGGELFEEQRWPGDPSQENLVWASGRRVAGAGTRAQWFGLKTHAENVELEADLEMHATREGYVGLCRLSDEVVNVCGLFRKAPGGEAQAWHERLRGPEESLLRERLGKARFLEGTFCSVAGISLEPQRARGRSDCRIGDALTMIPPVTGNGMSMAFESAELAIEPLTRYSRGEASWVEARDAIAAAVDRLFARRLAWAGWLQTLVGFGPRLPAPWVGLLLRWDGLWRSMVASTR